MTNLETSKAFENTHFVYLTPPDSQNKGVMGFLFNSNNKTKKALSAYNWIYKNTLHSKLYMEITLMESNAIIQFNIDKECIFIIVKQILNGKEFSEAMKNQSEFDLAIYEISKDVDFLKSIKQPINKKNIVISSFRFI